MQSNSRTGKQRPVRTSDFDYPLPPELIAQSPTATREQSRLLFLPRDGNRARHQLFPDLLGHLRAGDVLVLNNSKVIPARLRGVNASSRGGGSFEVLMLEENGLNDWWAMLRPGKKARLGTHIIFKNPAGELTSIRAEVTEINQEGHRRLRFTGTNNIADALHELGEIPLPPYIKRPDGGIFPEDLTRYQTVYAQPRGSIAAPTAGLHFTEALLQQIRERGVNICAVTLHVGLGTFAPVKADNISEHLMHEERYEVSEETAAAVNAAKISGRRVIAVGTTSVRVLESVAAANHGQMKAGAGRTKIFIHPPCEFRVVDALLTNFHLPCSTLLMLVSAFAAPGATRGRELILAAYAEAVRERYRFFSYGDAMLLI